MRGREADDPRALVREGGVDLRPRTTESPHEEEEVDDSGAAVPIGGVVVDVVVGGTGAPACVGVVWGEGD